MQTVTISSKYQVVILKKLREALHLEPGEKLQIFCYRNRLELIPIKDIKKMPLLFLIIIIPIFCFTQTIKSLIIVNF